MLSIFLAGLMVGSIATVLLILWYMVPKMERLYVFRPSRDVLKTPATLGVPYDQCFIDTKDGCRLSAWNICPEDPLGCIVYFHGNGGNLGTLVEILTMFHSYRLQVFALDYRGYGWSTGSPSEDGLYADATAAVDYFNANFRRPGLPVVFWGRSLGGCVAAYAARKAAPNGLILETAFPSKAQLLKHFPHFQPFRLFSRYRLDTLDYLTGHRFPILVIHGDKDRTVPFEQGRLLFDGLTGPKEFFRVAGAGHINIHMLDSRRYMQRVMTFVAQSKPPIVH